VLILTLSLSLKNRDSVIHFQLGNHLNKQCGSEMCGSWNFAFVSTELSRLPLASATASASALPATVIMLKIIWTPGPALINVACAKTTNASKNLYIIFIEVKVKRAVPGGA